MTSSEKSRTELISALAGACCNLKVCANTASRTRTSCTEECCRTPKIWTLRRQCLIIATLTLLALTPILHGQTTDATMLGTVTDSSGAIVRGASVRVTDVETGIVRVAQTDDLGNYEISALRPGTYSLLVESKGFKTYLRPSLSLVARAAVRADAILAVGQSQERVEVTAGAPVITTETGTITETMGGQSVLDLPANLRSGDTSPYGLVTTLPGVQIDLTNSISIAGSNPAMNELSVDGFTVKNISNTRSGINAEMLPSTETVSEVKVSELGLAEYAGVGDVSFVTRGGTNQYHGSLFEYFGNDDLNATPLFASSRPRVRANDFGGSVGGPVRFPFYNGADKTFFYFTYERNHQQNGAAITQGVPSMPMRTGDFSSLCSSYDANDICNDPNGLTLHNPFTGQPYPGNMLPSVNTVATNVLNAYYPQPNLNTSNLSANYAAILPAPVTTNLTDVRIDQKLTDKQSVWGRFSWKDITNSTPLGLLEGNADFTTHPRTVGLTYTYVIQPNLLNEFRFGYNHESDTTIYSAFPDAANFVTKTLGLDLQGDLFPGSAIPGFIFQQSGVTSTANGRENEVFQRTLQFTDNLSWTRGRHTMKFGTDIRKYDFKNDVVFTGADSFGVFDFDGRYAGIDIADFELGLPYQSVIALPGPRVDGVGSNYGFYAQDQFRVTPKLTINYGFRYEVHPPWFEKTLQLTNFLPTTPTTGTVVVPNAASQALASPSFLEGMNACPGYPGWNGIAPCTPFVTASQAHLPEALRSTQWNDFYPRINIAYRVTPGLVVRSGFGMYNQTTTGLSLFALVAIHTSNVQTHPNSVTNGVAAFQFPNTSPGGTGPLPTPGLGTDNFFTAESPNLVDPYAEQWNLSIDKQLLQNTGLRVTYTGMRSVNLSLEPNINQITPRTVPFTPAESPFPIWNLIYQQRNGGDAIYHGVETVLTHRFTQGLSFQSSYVFSKNLSDAVGSGCCSFAQENGPFPVNQFDPRYDYGDVGFTRRHRWLTTSLYEIPIGRGKRFGGTMSRALDAVIGNWQTTGILLIESGPYLTPVYGGGTDPSGTNANANGNAGQRPDRVCNGNLSHPTAAGYFEASCFVIPASNIGRFGNAGVGILRGPGTVNLDAGLAKIFPITEKVRLRFEATSVNALNHGNLGIPDLNIANTSDFGVIHSSQTSEGEGARTIQLGLRLTF
ncbi:MAG TPA: TonB-dependent receptor [Terriglobales bacterium]|nr:TonB-dependent receptor [Terriglobales bacterium]